MHIERRCNKKKKHKYFNNILIILLKGFYLKLTSLHDIVTCIRIESKNLAEYLLFFVLFKITKKDELIDAYGNFVKLHLLLGFSICI